ncbi:hypothetical protein [Oryza sativa Japonica Group]|uniref:Uncharacterized protein n=1 Tax=Oryza sativa subsp. japonica TaxID=39947 RepID=Q5N7B8_ORYSJ|nr:hypothetical protein [Oryza sativa Japonica Group]BAD82638.1 hypothetical protein [Oryza sativa Japonica Group]
MHEGPWAAEVTWIRSAVGHPRVVYSVDRASAADFDLVASTSRATGVPHRRLSASAHVPAGTARRSFPF